MLNDNRQALRPKLLDDARRIVERRVQDDNHFVQKFKVVANEGFDNIGFIPDHRQSRYLSHSITPARLTIWATI